MKFFVICRRVGDTVQGLWGLGWAKLNVVFHDLRCANEDCRQLMRKFDPATYEFSVVVGEYDGPGIGWITGSTCGACRACRSVTDPAEPLLYSVQSAARQTVESVELEYEETAL